MFYFDSNTTRPYTARLIVHLSYAALFFESLYWQDVGHAEGKSNCTDPKHGPRCVVTAIFYRRIKHGSFSSLSIGENHGTVLE